MEAEDPVPAPLPPGGPCPPSHPFHVPLSARSGSGREVDRPLPSPPAVYPKKGPKSKTSLNVDLYPIPSTLPQSLRTSSTQTFSFNPAPSVPWQMTNPERLPRDRVAGAEDPSQGPRAAFGATGMGASPPRQRLEEPRARAARRPKDLRLREIGHDLGRRSPKRLRPRPHPPT